MKLYNILILNIISVFGGNILHISDIHYDSRYHIGGVDNCILGDTGMGCCRKYDFPKKPYGYANEWGNYNCDAPIKLVNETFKWIKENLDIDKIIYTGDSVDHHDVSQTIGHNIYEINTIYELFRLYFPSKQLFHTLGNHDTYPIDQTVPHIYQKFLNRFSEINRLSNGNSSELNQIKYGGYFYDFIEEHKIKVISLNTMYYDTNNFFLRFENKHDPKGQWHWLELQLAEAKRMNQTVWLLLHIPPSNDKDDINYKTKFIDILSRYRDTIVATFSGHIHSDNFKLYFKNSELVGFGTIPSSLQPNKINPSFRVIEYDNNGRLINYKQYVSDLNKTIKNNKIEYEVNYDFKSLYDVNDFSKESFLQIYHNMRMNNTVLNKYYTLNKPDNKMKICLNLCRNELFNNILIR